MQVSRESRGIFNAASLATRMSVNGLNLINPTVLIRAEYSLSGHCFAFWSEVTSLGMVRFPVLLEDSWDDLQCGQPRGSPPEPAKGQTLHLTEAWPKPDHVGECCTCLMKSSHGFGAFYGSFPFTQFHLHFHPTNPASDFAYTCNWWLGDQIKANEPH